ncbi:SKA complex subunit 1 isoform X1 [Hemitrygon akajei]|uniref:SKA complex subunit 1 isoform X1 n=1 Tax=Hemitrygon akajei TaxID=2704970 RepID=UPI003BF9A367
MASLEDVSLQLNDKIASIKRLFHLKSMGNDPSLTTILQKIGLELANIQNNLDTFQARIQQQQTEMKSLKDLKNSVQKNSEVANHLLENIPAHLPRKTAQSSTADPKDEKVGGNPVQPEPAKKSVKSKYSVREIEYLLMEEFNHVPGYMKGRMTYDQINAVIDELNTAVRAKYKILNQPLKSMSNITRNQYNTFKEQETKETKGQSFFVEADIKDFTRLKVDKKLNGIFNILRHCHRIREVRGNHLVRYVLL